jgi:hypothetical protein
MNAAKALHAALSSGDASAVERLLDPNVLVYESGGTIITGETARMIHQSMRATLASLARHCHGDARPDCPILEDLGRVRTERSG